MKFCVQWRIGFFCFLLFCVEGFSIESEANQEKLSVETFEAVAYLTESLHGAGSPQAQRVQIRRKVDIEEKKEFAKKLSGVIEREE